MRGFDVSSVPINPDGWGPPESSVPNLPNLRANVPFTPFSRSEKLGRVADWTRNYSRRKVDPVFDFPADESFGGVTADDDEEPFKLVDEKSPPGRRRRFEPRRRFHPQRNRLPLRRDEVMEAENRARRDRLYHLRHPNGNAVFKSSVRIKPEWNMVHQFPFSTLSKLSFSVPEPEDLLICGSLEFYDKSYDRVTPKNARILEIFENHNLFKVTTTDDPVIRRLANEDRATVFATDSILSTLMCATRSVYSWDIVVQRVGNKLFFDKRDGSLLDLLPVHETSQESLNVSLPESKDDINSSYSLRVEAAYINKNLSKQVLLKDGNNKVSFEEPNPFATNDGETASVCYKYRCWKLEDEMHLVARCEVQCVAEINNERSFCTLNALNQFDPKFSALDWRQKLETQKGAVLANEMKNNANTLAKWTAQALLASADLMKLGYVTRVHPQDHFNHFILGIVEYKPKDIAAQINLNSSNMWGIVKSIVDVCMKLKEGKYVLVKVPLKPQVRIFEVPLDAFENDYFVEPLPENEQVQPRSEDDDDDDGGELGPIVASAASIDLEA